MTIAEYLDSVKERLLADEKVSAFSIIRERSTLTDGYLRVRLTLTDDSRLEFSEYVRQTSDDNIEVATYSYHWANTESNLIRRWDNTPHYPDLPGFPHHIHEGVSAEVVPGRPMNIFAVLDEVGRQLAGSLKS